MVKVGIIGAMELEVSALKGQIKGITVKKKAGMEFCEGTIGGVNVVVVRCGIGKVNAALCVQILCDDFGVSHVINTGVAGSLNNDLNIGDILISKDAVHHDVDVTIFSYKIGEVPQLGVREFPADQGLISAAEKAIKEKQPDLNYRIGRVASGDQFISSSEVKERIIKNFEADCAEMEGASIAHGAYLNGIPFVIIRAISDKADGSAEEDYPTFEKAAAAHCAKLVADMLTLI
ncbi:MAG: 5'-methylthioadenosine/adenosylhomocysteine nucleosidase [Lachnospiraceae bacterium]|nr:5'-methylthioadenosine/adenosylhomocysteine nucleosidase [Lachnospiraceae bacterium]MBP3754681.1 5'-methylthioadenosine/adenosylhomocysteine nucleosidase [Lachnospiraceae bacterium]